MGTLLAKSGAKLLLFSLITKHFKEILAAYLLFSRNFEGFGFSKLRVTGMRWRYAGLRSQFVLGYMRVNPLRGILLYIIALPQNFIRFRSFHYGVNILECLRHNNACETILTTGSQMGIVSGSTLSGCYSSIQSPQDLMRATRRAGASAWGMFFSTHSLPL
mgnify:CR=1 FL=1